MPEPARRILSIWLPALAVDRWRLGEGCARGQGADAAPLVLVTETAHGPRVHAANPAASAVGAAPGMRLADLRALYPAVEAVPADLAGDSRFLDRLAAWARRWGPWSALDPPEGLLVDVTGAAHLWGGEDALLGDVRRACARRGLIARAAAAPTAGAAWALAHHGPACAVLPRGHDVAAALADLPVAALRLSGETVLLLRRLGLKRIGDLAGIQREALARRFRNRREPATNPLIRLDQLVGLAAEPLLPVDPPQVPRATRRLLEPIRHRELLDQMVADLAADMEALLEKGGLGARRLELALWRVDADVAVRRLELAAAARDAAHLTRLFATRLDDIEAGFGIEIAELRAPWTEALALAQQDFAAQTQHPGTTLAVCLDRLAVRLGPGAVRRPVPRGSHVPERAQAWQPPLESQPAEQDGMAFHARPLKLLDRPERIAVLFATPDGMPRRFRWRDRVHEIARAEGPERIAPEWWRERGHVRLRDYYRIEDDAGRRYWIWRDGLAGDGRGGAPEWFLQGLWG